MVRRSRTPGKTRSTGMARRLLPRYRARRRNLCFRLPTPGRLARALRSRTGKEQIRAERTSREAPTKTKWWSSVHFDALWVTTQIPATYGVIGIHATHKISGRLQIFLAPGAMLLNVPTRRGNREWKPATDLGISYQLFDFRFPGNQADATLHVNVAGMGRGKPRILHRLQRRARRLCVSFK